MKDKRKTVPPIRPSAAIEANYQGKIDRLIEGMERSVMFWVQAAYRANEPEMAMDEDDKGKHHPRTEAERTQRTASQKIAKLIRSTGSTARVMERVMGQLGKTWETKFDTMAQEMAEHFATAAADRVTGNLSKVLKKAGWQVEFKVSKRINGMLSGAIQENVALIRNIPVENIFGIQQAVMRSVTAGRDLSSLSKELETRFGITKRRARFIARDQNNKITSFVTEERRKEAGITEAKWIHSHGGKVPRESHVKFAAGTGSGESPYYEVAEGALIDGERIFPGVLPNCRCVSRSVIPALGRR